MDKSWKDMQHRTVSHTLAIRAARRHQHRKSIITHVSEPRWITFAAGHLFNDPVNTAMGVEGLFRIARYYTEVYELFSSSSLN